MNVLEMVHSLENQGRQNRNDGNSFLKFKFSGPGMGVSKSSYSKSFFSKALRRLKNSGNLGMRLLVFSHNR
jgi:hypothetical protein